MRKAGPTLETVGPAHEVADKSAGLEQPQGGRLGVVDAKPDPPTAAEVPGPDMLQAFKEGPAGLGDVGHLALRQGIPRYLFKWVDGDQFQKYLDRCKLPCKRGYAHFLDSEGARVPGNSFTDEAHVDRWDNGLDTLIRIDTGTIGNRIFPVAGNRTYLKTMGMFSSAHDPSAWELEPDEVDEFWVAGPLDLSSAEIVRTARDGGR